MTMGNSDDENGEICLTENNAKRECAEHKPPEGKKSGRDVPEHDCL